MRRIPPKLALVVGAGFHFGLGLGCKPEDQASEHCFHAQGNETCVERYGDERPFCAAECGEGYSENYGCVAEEPADLACYSPCGGQKDANEDASCLGNSDTGTDTSSTTDTTDSTTDTTTGPGPCMANEDCTNPAQPFCDDMGACVDCSSTLDPDAACLGADPNFPVCIEGECVQCNAADASACMGTTPVCDLGTNTCIGCTDHDECPDSACNLALGSCMDVGAVYSVDGDGVSDYASLSLALADIGAQAEITLVFHEANYAPESIVIDTNGYVAIVAAPGENPTVTGNGGNPSFTIHGGSTLYLARVSASGTQNGGRGVLIDGGSAWVQRCKVVNNSGGGIVVDGGGNLVLDNSFVGGDISDVVALAMTSGTLEANYVTLGAGFGTSAALTCADGVGKAVRNSLLVSRSANPELACPNITITESALEMMVGSNLALGDVDTLAWFDGYGTGDFGLSDTAPPNLATAAIWQSGDPTTDIDGDLRPTTPGTPDYAGADIP